MGKNRHLLCSVLFGFYEYVPVFGSVRVLVNFLNGGFWFCSVLSKKRVLVRFVRFGFGSIPISTLKLGYHQIKSALEQISDDVEEKACVRCEAEGLVARLNQLLEFTLFSGTTSCNEMMQLIEAYKAQNWI